jgi:hypothetical protein
VTAAIDILWRKEALPRHARDCDNHEEAGYQGALGRDRQAVNEGHPGGKAHGIPTPLPMTMARAISKPTIILFRTPRCLSVRAMSLRQLRFG